MGDITTFPTIRNVLVSGKNITQMTATTAVKAGQVVAINATGVDMALDPAVATAGSRSIGVALYGVSAGAEVAVAGMGCIVNVANADDTTGIDAGGYIESNDNAVGGTVSESAVADVVGAVGTAHYDIIGIAIQDIAGGGTGNMLICPMTLVQLNAS